MSREACSGALSRLELASRMFDRMIELGENLMVQGTVPSAVRCAEYAARFAWYNHAGAFASPRLELILESVSRSIKEIDDFVPQVNEDPRRVLHVVTRALSIGGHTRLVWRWIQNDRDRMHSVVFTNQGSIEIPSTLSGAVTDSGGSLQSVSGDVFDRCKELRRIARAHDRVVLHTNPDDGLPNLAFSGSSGLPPIVYLNHADHVFWVGAQICDLVACVRESGLDLAVRRRGVSRDRAQLLPIPLMDQEPSGSRAEARRSLGLPPHATILLSIAEPYKYVPFDELHFAKAMLPVLHQDPEAVLVVVGPEARGEWKDLASNAGGRILMMGRRKDVSLFYQAADIYVDSYPVPSLTSALEAGLSGLPLISYGGPMDRPAILRLDSPGLEEFLIAPRTLESWTASISKLVADPGRRAELGKRTREFLASEHSGDRWCQAVQRLYDRSWSIWSSSRIPRSSLGLAGSEDVDVGRLQANSVTPTLMGLYVPDWDSSLPWRSRLRVIARAIYSDWRFSLVLIAGRFLGPVVQQLGSFAARVLLPGRQ